MSFISCSFADKLENKSRAILIEPINAHDMKITVTKKNDECYSPDIPCQVGVTVYVPKDETDSQDENFMSQTLITNTRPLVMKYGSKEHKVALKLVDAILTGKKQLPLNSPVIYSALHLFDECQGFVCVNLTSFNDLAVPHTDSAKTILTLDSDEGLNDLVVRIIAKHSDQYFLMTGKVIDPNLDIAWQRCMNTNEETPCYNNKNQTEQNKCINTVQTAQTNCYKSYIKSAPVVQQQIQATTDNLLKEFAL